MPRFSHFIYASSALHLVAALLLGSSALLLTDSEIGQKTVRLALRNYQSSQLQQESTQLERTVQEMELYTPDFQSKLPVTPKKKPIETNKVQQANVKEESSSTHNDQAERVESVKAQSATLLRSPKPPYPSRARKQGFEGDVVLDVMIDQSGRVTDAEIIQASGRSDCDKAALRTILRDWLFKPARRLGFPVPSTERIVVSFRLR